MFKPPLEALKRCEGNPITKTEKDVEEMHYKIYLFHLSPKPNMPAYSPKTSIPHGHSVIQLLQIYFEYWNIRETFYPRSWRFGF